MFQPFSHLCGTAMNLLQDILIFFVLWPGHSSTWTQHSWCLTSTDYWSRITSLDLLAMLLLMQPRTPSAFFAARAHCCLIISLVITRIFPSKLPSSQLVLFLSRSRTFLWHFPSPLRHLWMAAQLSGLSATPPSFVSPVNLLRVHPVPLSRSLMTLNRTGPSTDTRNTPTATSLQLDFVLLITILWARQLSQFLIHLTAPTYLGCTSWLRIRERTPKTLLKSL